MVKLLKTFVPLAVAICLTLFGSYVLWRAFVMADAPVALGDVVATARDGKPAAIEAAGAHTPVWSSPYLWATLSLGVAPLLFFAFAKAGSQQPAPKAMPFGRSRARLYDRAKALPVTFADVAGVEEGMAELAEIVRFLKEPDRFRAMGARVPKGVLLVGPPGTGKTLLARAVAGEAGVPFFSMSGSEFIEMFVGVGAARVRDLFAQAKEKSPCILFIDELDAVGKSRASGAGMVSNEEREQTLNQLLVEMDGFDPGTGIIVMAATNRPELLDKALLRAGRFDRDVLIDCPDARGREAILRIHSKKIALGADVDLALVAKRTPGMVGADLANAVNEAALASVRRDAPCVTARDFEEAIDRIQLGLKKQGRAMTERDRKRIAYHEAGHAIVALLVPHADPVHRVTIVSRSIGALGATLQLPESDRYLMTKDELRDQVCVLFGGRVAEAIALGDISTGAENDLERASDIARQMVCRFGMSDKLGPLSYGKQGGGRFLPGGELVEGRSMSEATARAIDAEVRALVDAEHARARRLLVENQGCLDAVAQALLARETLDRFELEDLVTRTRARCA